MKAPTMFLFAIFLVACAGRDDAGVDTAAAASATPPAGATTAQIAAGDVQAPQLFDPNAATFEQLMTAPGMDSAAVAAVIGGRPHADMVAVDKILAAHNRNPEQRKAIYTKVWKPIDLNTASKAEILLIPGVGNRMLHEFEEYRPYTSMEQFRREIGKYVNKTELERLATYVSVK